MCRCLQGPRGWCPPADVPVGSVVVDVDVHRLVLVVVVDLTNPAATDVATFDGDVEERGDGVPSAWCGSCARDSAVAITFSPSCCWASFGRQRVDRLCDTAFHGVDEILRLGERLARASPASGLRAAPIGCQSDRSQSRTSLSDPCAAFSDSKQLANISARVRSSVMSSSDGGLRLAGSG